MVIAGVTCYPNRWPRPRTTLAVKWTTLHKGLWRATARPASNDQYEADIEIWDSQAVVDALYTALKENVGAMTVSLGTGDEQYIFGADVTCTSATVVQYGTPREAGSFKMFSLPLRLKALNPTFTGSGAAWPDVIWTQGSWLAGSSFEIAKVISQNNNVVYQDLHETEGIFEAEFLFKTEQMRQVRRRVATLRGAQTTFPDIGVEYPFGTTLSGFTGCYVRVIGFEDYGRINYLLWRCRLKLAYDGQTS